MEKLVVIGVDPGFSGGIAFLYDDNTLQVHDMPTKQKKNGKREVDAGALADLVYLFRTSRAVAFVEEVGGMTYVDKRGEVRGQGSAASFAFGKATGVVIGVLAANGIPTLPLFPSVWKPALGLSSNKAQSVARAVFLFPANAASFGRLKDDGRAEAAIMAWYGMRTLKGAR